MWHLPQLPHISGVSRVAPISRALLLSVPVLNQGPFPPPALPGFPGTTGLSATPQRPASPSRAAGWSSQPTTPRGFPCCVRFPCVHAVATTPAQRLGACFALFPSRISLPRNGDRVGLRIVLFEACSAFTYVTACTLALSPIRDTLHRRVQPFCYLHSCSGCFRLERLPGGTCTHWEAPPFTAHARSGHFLRLGGRAALAGIHALTGSEFDKSRLLIPGFRRSMSGIV